MNVLKARGGAAALLTESQKEQVQAENQKADEKSGGLQPSKSERDSYDSNDEAKRPWETPVLACPFGVPNLLLNKARK